MEHVRTYKVIQKNVVVALFLYYFIGMVISRIESLCVAPLMVRVGFVKFAPYTDFVAAAAKDSKLDTLSKANNTYRTLCSLLLALGLVKIYEQISLKIELSSNATVFGSFVLLFALFAFAYRKQTRYIVRRIETRKE